jgi:hypothetical protein
LFGGRAAVNVEYDSDWFHKKAEFWGYNDVSEAEKCIIEKIHGATLPYKGYSGVKKEDIGPENTCFKDGRLKY